jgi:hypothetical protein
MRFFYSTCALTLALIMAAPAAAQAPATVKPTTYKIFLRGTQIGTEQVTVREDATGTTITVQGRLAPRSTSSRGVPR